MLSSHCLWAQTGMCPNSTFFLILRWLLKQLKTLAWVFFVLFCFVFGSMHQKLNTSKTSLLVVCILNKHMFKENHLWTHLVQDVKICIFAFASKTVNLFICRWKPGTLHFRKKKKKLEMLFCELSYVFWTFYNRKESPKSPFLHSFNKGMSQFIKKSYTTILLARFYSPNENLVQSTKIIWKSAWNFPVADVSTEGACMPFVNTAPYGTQCDHCNITSK